MLDLPRIRRIRLSARPRVQRLIGTIALWPNYSLPPRVKIRLEGLERVPAGPVLYAMNHTDRYNYWPFQYQLWRTAGRFTATWVKGKYYERELLARFMEWTNNIPTVSRGYIITKDVGATLGRRPTDEEYAALRGLVDARAGAPGLPELPSVAPLFKRARDILGRPFDPTRETWDEAISAVFDAMMARFVELNREAVELGLDVLIFPQGTRSKRLSRGHIGLPQIALTLGLPIVPVGCSGSDKVYPGSSPFAKGGEVIYRFGAPIGPGEQAAFAPGEPFTPFSPAAERAHRERFQGLVDVVMDRIEGLVDEEYRFASGKMSGGVKGSDRFV
ncbi:MAG: hypothetical protein CSA66_07315 [Proteobacteria bacterium]|nr:MAG: hypothetical protein CSA66_07315 [Pseudomonadota bacterium]